MFNLKIYTCFQVQVHLNGTWKYKTYGNPVYITMIKKLSISRCTLTYLDETYSAGIVSY